MAVEVKTLVTLALVAVFCAMALSGSVAEGTVTQTVLMVIVFYFGVQSEKKAGGTKASAESADEAKED